MKEYTATEIAIKLKNGEKLNLIDVREVDEVLSGKIPGALHIPLGLLEFRLHELDKNKEYVMICRSGGRSGTATQLLTSRGFHAVNMNGGMLDWNGDTE